MTSKRLVFTVTGGVLLLTMSLGVSAAAACDENFVSVTGNVISVLPTGVGDDTVNLQCAFDLGSVLGPGGTVNLAEGTFYTEQLVISNFRGRIVGMGQGVTILHTPNYPLPVHRPCLQGTLCFSDDPPSLDNPHPSLVSVMGGDLVMSDFSLVAEGGWGTELWGSNRILSSMIQVLQSHTSMRLERLAIESGPLVQASGIWTGDAANAIYVPAFNWMETPLSNVNWLITDSLIRAPQGFYAYNMAGSRVMVWNSRIEASYSIALALFNLRETQVLVGNNDITAATTAVQMLRVVGTPGPIVDSTLWFGNNRLAGGSGFRAGMGSLVNVKCEMVNNDTSATGTPYFLNDNTCKVAGGR